MSGGTEAADRMALARLLSSATKPGDQAAVSAFPNNWLHYADAVIAAGWTPPADQRALSAVANLHKVAGEATLEDYLALRSRIRALATQWKAEPSITGHWVGRTLLDVLDKEYPADEEATP